MKNLSSFQSKKQATMPSQKSHISLDGPALDFTYKGIESLEALKSTDPRSGKKKENKDVPLKADKRNQYEKGNFEYPVQEKDREKNQSSEQLDQMNESQDQKDNEDKNETDEKNVDKDKQKKKVENKQYEIIRAIPQQNAFNVQNIIANNNITANSNIIKNNQGGGMYNAYEKQVFKVKKQTTSLFLGYNDIPSISNFYNIIDSIMFDCINLRWIDLSHNKLQRLDYDFKDFPHLTHLYLHCNLLFDLNDLFNLSHLKNLRALTIHGQPIEQISGFRLYIIGILPQLKKIDTVLISEKEKDNAKVLVLTFKKVKIPKTQTQAQQQSKYDYPKKKFDNKTKDKFNQNK